jgi:hypothetical protein
LSLVLEADDRGVEYRQLLSMLQEARLSSRSSCDLQHEVGQPAGANPVVPQQRLTTEEPLEGEPTPFLEGALNRSAMSVLGSNG